MTARLEITNGTSSVSLLSGYHGFNVLNWEPDISDYKTGGIFAESLFADGRGIIQHSLANATETITLTLNGVDSDAVYDSLQRLRALLEDASLYWEEDWRTTPVYLIAQASGESNPRYATIVRARIVGEGNPFSQPFLQAGNTRLMSELDLVIERDQWQDVPPTTGTDIADQTAPSEEYNGKVYGAEATKTFLTTEVSLDGGEVANLTHIYFFDSSAGTYSANLYNSTPPFILVPSTVAAGDFLYFGIDSTSDVNAFVNLVVNLAQGLNGTVTSKWQYASGGWVDYTASAVNDPSGGMEIAGEHAITFPNGSGSVSVNGVQAIWIRLNFIGASGVTQAATVQNYAPMVANWNYFDVPAAALGGNMPALFRIDLANRQSPWNAGGYVGAAAVVLASRSTSRGNIHTSFTPCSTVNLNATGVTYNETRPADLADIPASGNVTSGVRFDPNSGGGSITSWAELFYWRISSTVSQNYLGKYLAFVSFTRYDAPDIMQYRLRVTMGGQTRFISRTFGNEYTAPVGGVEEVQVLGLVDMSAFPGCQNPGNIDIALDAYVPATTGDVTDFWRLSLLPADEYIAVAELPYNPDDATDTKLLELDEVLQISAVCDPRYKRRASVYDEATDVIEAFPVLASGGVPHFEQGETQRVFCFAMSRDVSSSTEKLATFWGTFELKNLYVVKRYYSGIGSGT